VNKKAKSSGLPGRKVAEEEEEEEEAAADFQPQSTYF